MVRTRTSATAVLALALSIFMSSTLAAGQPGRAIVVAGGVTDATGAPVAGAVVEAVAAGRIVRSGVTRDDGRFGLEIAAGVPFELRVRREGFADYVAAMTGAATDLSHEVTLQLGRVSDTLVVTASRGSETRDQVTQSVSVLTADDLQALGARALADGLRFVPGMNVEGIGREGAVTSVFARGGESDYNLVLVDGVRMNEPGGFFDFGRLLAGEIQRVEVVRGAQSALWGSDAMGSVVHVITRRAERSDEPRVSGDIEGGSFNSWRGDLRLLGGARRRVEYAAGVHHRRTDGAFADILPEDDWFEGSSFDAGIGAALGNTVMLRSAVRVNRSQARSVGPISFGARDAHGVYDTTDVSWHADVSHTAGRRFTGSATLNYFRYSGLSEDTVADPYMTYVVLSGTPDAPFPNGTRLVRLVTEPEFLALAADADALAPGQFLASAFGFDSAYRREIEFDRPAVRYQGDIVWGAGRVSAGAEWEHERQVLRDRADVEVDNTAAFVQQQLAFADRLFVTAGVRADRREGYGTYVSPKLSAGGFIVRPRRGALSSLKVFGNIGKGIKSPTLFERFGDQFADPAPDLKVERARTADVGAEATFADGRVRASATRFDNAYRDQVAYRFGPLGDGIPEYLNIDGSKADGWELEAALLRLVPGVTVSGSYTYLDTRVVTSASTSQQFAPGQPLLRRPKSSGSLRGAYTQGRVTVHGDLLVVGQRHDNSFLFLETVPNAAMPAPLFTDISVNPGYTIAGLGLDVRVDRQLTFFARVNNVGDTAYDSVLGYPGMPRTVTAGARFTLGRP